ncbi:MAG: serine/threonine protein kinase, partial [Thermoguttaceae bacterium]|nr:serine/threonine protein kinase [Thermoguttaceae bacterium]
MAIKDSSTVMRIIEKSRLLQLKDLEEARALSEQIPDSHEFLKQLFRKKKITRWQAGQLSAGNTSFFLGKYKLVELIGAGGMGRVFRAEHITMNRSVALKIIAKELVTDADAQKRFLNEARAIASLNHPNIVHAYSVDKEGDRYYIVMEFVEGTDLEKTVEKNGAVAQDRVAVFMHQAAGALQHAHERGMIHCDIKPANLLLNESEQIKILDMGLARFQNSDKGKADSNDLNQNVIGTVDYMAPEVAEDSANVSPQSDIYSLGCVMFFLLTGEIPFPGETIPERILKHQNGEPKNPTEINDAISPRLAEICLKMMARELSERYQSAEEVAEDLAQWLRSGMKEESEAGSSSISLDFSNFAASDDSKSLKAASSKKSGFFGLSSKKKESSGSRIGLGKEEERIENGSENDQGKAGGLESHAADLEKRTKDTAKNFSVPDFSNLGNLEVEEKDESEGNPFEELAGIFGNSVGGTEKNLKLKENPGALNRSSKERPAPVSDEKSAIEDEYGDEILKATDKKRNSEEDEVREHSEPAEETVDRLNLDESSPNHEDLEETIVANEEELESDGEISEAGNEAKKLSKEKSKSGILDDFGSESDNLLSKKMKNEKTDSKDATSLEPWGILGDSLEKKVKNSSLDLTGKAEKSFSMPKLPAKKVWAERPDSHEAESQNKNKESKIKAMTVKLSEIFAGAIGWFVGLSSKQKIIYGSVAGGSCLVLLLVLIFCLGSGDEKEIAQKNAVEPMVEDIIDETVEEVSNESTDEDSTPDGENADGENADGEKADGEKADGEKA